MSMMLSNLFSLPLLSFVQIDNEYQKELTFFNEVKDKLQSKYLYHEFLRLLNLFSQEIVTKSEVLMLVKQLFVKHSDLFESFKTFVAFDEPEIVQGNGESMISMISFDVLDVL